MSSKFSLQRPYVVAPLPKPIDRSSGRYVVADVYGGAPSQKKRKRSEVAVGIDGEGVNLYDIGSSKLITSYALPPRSSFTCAPASLRLRFSKAHAERRTYTSTSGSQSQVTLFRDDIGGLAETRSSTITRTFEGPANPIVFLGTTIAAIAKDMASESPDLLVVKKNGEINCLDGCTLQDKWMSPATALKPEDTKETSAEVEFALLTKAYTVIHGIFKGRQDIFAMFPQEISEEGFNPDILVMVCNSGRSEKYVHVAALPQRSTSATIGTRHSVHLLLSAQFPTRKLQASDSPIYNVHVSGGVVQQLHDRVLTTFDLTETGLKEQSKLSVGNARSFLRLSNTSIMVATEDAFSVFNPKYQSILSTIDFELNSDRDSLKRKRGEEPDIISSAASVRMLTSFFPKLSAAVAVVGSNLVAVHIEGNQDRRGRPRADGLLIDSLGCTVLKQLRNSGGSLDHVEIDSKTLSKYLPGSLNSPASLPNALIKELDFAVLADDGAKFDELLSKELKIEKELMKSMPKGPNSNTSPRHAANVDRRWVSYVLSKIFSWVQSNVDYEFRLVVSFYCPKTFLWLIQAGHMTVSNIQSSVKNTLAPGTPVRAGELVAAVVDINPDMDFLRALIENNYLEAAELISAIRLLMDSLELLGESAVAKQRLLTNGDTPGQFEPRTEERLQQLEAEAELDLQLAEYQLGDGSGTRGQALSLALSKLYKCPTSFIISGLQTALSNHEIICLVYLLRFELNRGSWTSRYLDTDPEVVDEELGSPESAIILISTLLSCCIDAIGTGGWMSEDPMMAQGDYFKAEDLISSLKDEVSAALEATEEASYLTGIISEMVRYGAAIQKSTHKESSGKKSKGADNKPVTLRFADPDHMLLPLGLKPEQQISLLKVGAGGEVHTRTMRDIGNLKSHKVGKYSLERITI
ncbi:hypothetical protein BJ875DRAFT_452378 [Amylocarpus encephaloides]|uniref:Utp8 beta-propeller domain-containing protein n=1 Tax=Amylocarpus encephaloides TaxID=45428 RepID=A0A9P8C923_9HELO|nr:hypothetical protein BJ875DRAFT_452378 [Amylocarpus encephaloides]